MNASDPTVRNIPGSSEREGPSIAPGESGAQAGARAVEMSRLGRIGNAPAAISRIAHSHPRGDE